MGTASQIRRMSRTLFTATGAALAFSASAQTADPSLESALTPLAEQIQANANRQCLPQHDGDKSKGELINAEIAMIVRAAATIPARFPNIDANMVTEVFAHAAQNSYGVCFDSRVKSVTSAHLPPEAQPFVATLPVNAVAYGSTDTIAMTPVPVDSKNAHGSAAIALFDAFYRLGQLNQALDAIAETDQRRAISLLGTPFVIMHNAEAPWRSQMGPAPGLQPLMTDPPIRKAASAAPAAT